MDRRNEGAKRARGARNFIWIQIVSHSRRLSGTTGAPVAPSASRSGNPKEMVLSLYALTGLRVQGEGYADDMCRKITMQSLSSHRLLSVVQKSGSGKLGG